MRQSYSHVNAGISLESCPVNTVVRSEASGNLTVGERESEDLRVDPSTEARKTFSPPPPALCPFHRLSVPQTQDQDWAARRNIGLYVHRNH